MEHPHRRCGAMTEPRNGIFVLKDWAQLLLAMGAVVGMVSGLVIWVFASVSPYRNLPADVQELKAGQIAIDARIVALSGTNSPQVVHFLGAGKIAVPRVKAGGRVAVTYVLRRTIDCETMIRVRFFDYSDNTTVNAYDIPAVRSPVSPTFNAFTVRVAIPKDMEPGVYSYFPEIVPLNCGVYGAIVPPMSDVFEVTE